MIYIRCLACIGDVMLDVGCWTEHSPARSLVVLTSGQERCCSRLDPFQTYWLAPVSKAESTVNSGRIGHPQQAIPAISRIIETLHLPSAYLSRSILFPVCITFFLKNRPFSLAYSQHASLTIYHRREASRASAGRSNPDTLPSIRQIQHCVNNFPGGYGKTQKA